MSLVDALPCALIDSILCHAGPIALARNRTYVAATRIQRCWRRTRLTNGVHVLYRYRWMRTWKRGRIHADESGVIAIRGEGRVIFNIDRKLIKILVVSAPRDVSR